MLTTDVEPTNFRKRGVGRGHTKNGSKKSWRKRFYFEQDLLELKLQALGNKKFTNHFGGTSAADIKAFWSEIRTNCIRVRETNTHARNKLILWLDKMHNSPSWKNIEEQYKIGSATAVGYIQDVLSGILKTFKHKNISVFPNENQRLRIVDILIKQDALMPFALFTLDGKHAL